MDETPSSDQASQPEKAAPPLEEVASPPPSGEPAFDALGQPVPARSFDPALDESTRAFGSPRPMTSLCQWCNQPLPEPGPDTCPNCGAALKPVQEDLAIPGVTVSPVDPREALARTTEQLAAYAVRTPESGAPGGDRPAFEPPSLEVRRTMLEMELVAQGVPEEDAAAAVGDLAAGAERPPEAATPGATASADQGDTEG